ncbi:MAG: rhomboid family intramembrane serine protease [Planctomycetes bacterium]|nr:rhomboid family intramembrane serine protease [Planctomycetota bacterium]
MVAERRDILLQMSEDETRAVVCDSCSRLISAADRSCPHCGATRIGGSTALRVRALLRGRSVTKMLFWANIILYIAGLALSGASAFEGGGAMGFLSARNEVNAFLGALYTESIKIDHEYWRLLTCAFLHGGLLHIVLNMLSLWSLGKFIESEFGSTRFSIIYVGSAISASIAVILLNSACVGASGAICGLLGAGLALGVRVGGAWGQMVKQQLLQNVLLIVILSVSVPNVSWQGHAGGFAGGFALGFLLAPPIRRSAASTAEPPFISMLGGIALLLVPLSFIITIVGGWFAPGMASTGFRSNFGAEQTVRIAKSARIQLAALGAAGWSLEIPKGAENALERGDAEIIIKYPNKLALSLSVRPIPEAGVASVLSSGAKGLKIIEPLKTTDKHADIATRDEESGVWSRVHAHDLGDRVLLIEWSAKNPESQAPPGAELMENLLRSLRQE